jgi:hypothetical protein
MLEPLVVRIRSFLIVAFFRLAKITKSFSVKGMVGAVGIELVGQSLSLAESTALTPLHPSKTLLELRILATSWPRIFFHGVTVRLLSLPT